MPASATDKFKYLARKWVGQIGSGGVADASVTTVPLSSATNLPTTTGITVVIDRVDANGTKTPSLEETITGVVSGNNLVTCTRGVEGTAGAHAAGAVVEVLFTAADWQSVMDGILVEHAQDGTHASTVTKNASVQTLTNKKLSDSTTTVVNVSDATKVLKTDLSGATAGKTMTIASPHTDNRTVTLPDATDTLVGKATTDILTNKRRTPRVDSQASTSTITPEISTYDQFVRTAQAAALTINNHSTSTPADGEIMLFELTCDGTNRALSFGNKYLAKAGTALPTTLTASKTTTMLFKWSAGLTGWNLLAVGQET